MTPLFANLLQLTAVFLLFDRILPRVLQQSILLVVAGGLALLWAGADWRLVLLAIGKNQEIIAMFVAVGCLRLVPFSTSSGAPPNGRIAIWQTLFGVHWLGSITNFSAIILFADRMVDATGRLETVQALVLARGFALAALWSPFFAAMGVALGQAPDARLITIMLWGVPISLLLMVILGCQLTRSGATYHLSFTGYPFRLDTMLGPVFLATTVLVLHLLKPTLSAISIVTIAVPVYTFIACRLQAKEVRFKEYIRNDLPRMGPEVILFISAGVLGAGFSTLIDHYAFSLPVGCGGPLAVSLGLAVIVALAGVGIHPIVGITAVSSVLSHAGIPSDLLALSYLMGWGLGVIISPNSGINLLLASRYYIPISRLWRMNLGFVACAYMLCCGWLFVFSCFAFTT